MQESKRVLFISSEISPYLPESPLATSSQNSIVTINKLGYQVRALSPKFGVINERKYQLHEVVRLSGMNIQIDNVSQPLIIKVASLPKERVQVYFIDNEDYFKRKAIYGDEETPFFKDNEERLLFFTRGVIETIKKLAWTPDIIHIQGWMTYLIPAFIREVYQNEPIFKDSKIVLSYFGSNSIEDVKNFTEKIEELPDYKGLIDSVASHVDGAIIPNDADEVKKILEEHNTSYILEVDKETPHHPVLEDVYKKLLD